ncbi:endolytic transglycosylase MltG [Ginsengibacter hankyongi]|uniref:Endolytic murein transglycosylase n=1 Tax=Ginsengibacter hankyongi TaxID=2607284 RepID=A0A5J5IH11_9BACT|nr:endolytic transglycosylase MltG [Ginsengibacter hankyongi]KAA9038506.1 endolytic transglycosylase MltG [Ginsengibacter hankyongi]
MKIRRIILFFFVAIFLILIYGAWEFFGPTIQPPAKKFFYIHSGATYQQVKDSLKKNGIIGTGFWFDKVATYSHYDKNVKAGKYKITDGMSVVNLVKMLRNGRQSPVNLIITKLRTKEDLAKKIADNFETDSLTVINFLNNNDSVLQFDVDTNTVMTIIIPNTYTYTWNTPVTNVFKKLYSEEHKFWNEDRLQKAERLHLTPKEVYTIASIVEEETNRPEDKGKIASVYINRLRKGMRLAADPTIKFAMKDFGLKRIYFKYLSYPSPYNTYLHTGLPPGPINTPSIKTIDAVLDAPETDYLFFVARPNSGGLSDFSSTFQEHSAYAKAYRDALDSSLKEKQENQ